MAKINKVEKARNAYRCGKCGKLIEVGSPYVWAKPRYGSKMIRCVNCGIRSWETSSSDYIQTVGDLVENWEENIGASGSTTEEIIGTLEELRDNCQDSLDNMPESLQYSDTGQLLQERIDELDNAISELEGIDYEDYIHEEEEDEEEDEDAETDEEDEEDEEGEAEFIEAVNEALSGLSY